MLAVQLTDREHEVLRLASGGLSNEEIAQRLAISRRTVEAHLRALFRKAGVGRRAQLVARYQGGELALAQRPTPAPGGDLADCQQQLRAYTDALRGLVDRQFPLFEERVEITLVVGEQDGQDVVIERRWTIPRPYLVYRIVGPVVTPGALIDADHLALSCTMSGEDIHVDVHMVRDADARPLALILFQPGLGAETEWVLRYHSPGLWDPLRRTGADTLTWATATLDQRHPPKIDALTVKVIFPGVWADAGLAERSNRGVIHTKRLAAGQTQVTWHHDAPTAGVYHWALRVCPRG